MSFTLKNKDYLDFIDLGFHIEYSRLYSGTEPTPYFLVKKNSEEIGVVTESYQPVKVEDYINKVLEDFPGSKVLVEDRSNYLLATLRLDGYRMEDDPSVEKVLGKVLDLDYDSSGNDFYSFPCFFFTNSYNGTTRFSMNSGLYRQVCSNGLVVGEEVFHKTFVHRGRSNEEEVENTPSLIARLCEFYKTLLNANIMVESTTIYPLLLSCGFGSRILKKIRESLNRVGKMRLWTVVNLVTFLSRKIKTIRNDYYRWNKVQHTLNEFIASMMEAN